MWLPWPLFLRKVGGGVGMHVYGWCGDIARETEKEKERERKRAEVGVLHSEYYELLCCFGVDYSLDSLGNHFVPRNGIQLFFKIVSFFACFSLNKGI